MERDNYYQLQTNILCQADDFAETYKRCIEHKNPRIDKYGRRIADVVNVPAIVNAAFSCELYLKYLSETEERGHNLKKFYNLLDIETQNIIRNNINKSLDPRLFNFDDMLQRASNVFEDWRYIFEKPHTDGFKGTFINEYLKFFALFLPELQRLSQEKYNLKINN